MQHQKEYYEIYQQVADPTTKQLSATAAVNFFNGSQLPRHVLGTIWSLVADPRYSGLHPQQFYLCLRLIALVQSQGTRLLGPQVLSYLHQMNLPLARFSNTHAPKPAAPKISSKAPMSNRQSGNVQPKGPKHPQHHSRQLHQQPQQQYQYQKQQMILQQSHPNHSQHQTQQPRHPQQQWQHPKYPQQHHQNQTQQYRQRTQQQPPRSYPQKQMQQPLGPQQPHLKHLDLQAGQQFNQPRDDSVESGQPQYPAKRFVQSNAAMWEPTTAEKKMYTPLFTRLDAARRGFLAGKELVTVLRTSNLPNEQLKKIWMVAASVAPGPQPTQQPPQSLTLRQFIAALHLVGVVQQNESATVDITSLGTSAETPVPRLADGYIPQQPTEPEFAGLSTADTSSTGLKVASAKQERLSLVSHEAVEGPSIPAYKGVGSPQPTFATSSKADAFAGLAGLGVLKNIATPPTEPDALVEPSTSTAEGAGTVARIGNLSADNTGRERDAQLNGVARAHGGVDPSVGIGPGRPDSASETVSSRLSQNLAADVVVIENNNLNDYGTVSPSSEGPSSNNAALMPAPEPTITLEQMNDKLFDELDQARTGTLAGKKVAQHLARSQLRRQTLKSIWLLCAKSSVKTGQSGNYLTRPEFLNVMKLIALAQSCFESNGIDWEHESLEALLQRCEKFDLPAPLFTSTEEKEAQRALAGCPGMQSYEKAYYDVLWVKCTGGGPLTEFIAAQDAVTLFRSSGLPEHILKTIWITAMSGKSQMSINEFYKALRLVAAARCQLPLVEDTIYEYPCALPVFTGYPHPIEPPLRKEPPLPKDEIPSAARNQSDHLSGAFSALGTYGQPYAQHSPNVNHFSPTSMPSNVPLRSLAGKAELTSQLAPTFEHPNTYADKPNSHPVLQPCSLPGDAYASSAQSSPGHLKKFPSMASPSPGPSWSSAMPAQKAQSQQHEEQSWGKFSSGTETALPAENTSDGIKLALQQPGLREPKFSVDPNVVARNSSMMSGLSTEVKVPAITQPSALSSSDKGMNTDDEDDWADFSTAGGTAATNTEMSTPAFKAKSNSWSEFSAQPPSGISPPKTPAAGNLLSPAAVTDNVGSAPGMKPPNANAISSLFDAFDGLSVTSPSSGGATEKADAGHADTSLQSQVVAETLDTGDDVEDEWADFSSAPNDVHDSATAVAPPPAAGSTESLTEHVGAISLEIDEDDPFHDHAVSSLAYDTTSDFVKSRQAQIERLEQKRLQDEEKQHTMNNPFGQDEYTTEVAIGQQTAVDSDNSIQQPTREGDDEWAEFGSGETSPAKKLALPHVPPAVPVHSSDPKAKIQSDPFVGDDDEDWSGFGSGGTPAPVPAPAATSAHASRADNDKKEDPFGGDDDDDKDWDDFESGSNSAPSIAIADTTKVSANDKSKWQPLQAPEYKYPLDCDGDNLLLTLLHSGRVVMAGAYAQHMQAQKDLEALQRKMAAAVEDEDFEAAGRIKKERVAVRARMASEETQQEWRGRPRDDCLGAAHMFNTVLELRSLENNDFLDTEIAMLDGFLEFASGFAQKTPDTTCMVAYIAQYHETVLAYHITTALATHFRGHCDVWSRLLSAAAAELTQAAALTEQASRLPATDKWQKYLHAVTRIHAVASRVLVAKASCFCLDGAKPPMQALLDCGTGAAAMGAKLGDLQLTDTAPNRIWSLCTGFEKASVACSLCLLPIDLQNGQSVKGAWYHVECANLWLNRVEADVADLPKPNTTETPVKIARRLRWV